MLKDSGTDQPSRLEEVRGQSTLESLPLNQSSATPWSPLHIEPVGTQCPWYTELERPASSSFCKEALPRSSRMSTLTTAAAYRAC